MPERGKDQRTSGFMDTSESDEAALRPVVRGGAVGHGGSGQQQPVDAGLDHVGLSLGPSEPVTAEVLGRPGLWNLRCCWSCSRLLRRGLSLARFPGFGAHSMIIGGG